jgi:hypothetical protein
MDAADPAPALLACVYYRVGADDAARAIAAVREFQRGLPARFGALDAQVLVRSPLPDAAPAPATDPTLMETYRLALPGPASSDAAAARVRDFLAALATAAAPLGAWQRGDRHVELFAPCA